MSVLSPLQIEQNRVEIESHHITLTGLELDLYTRLEGKSWTSGCPTFKALGLMFILKIYSLFMCINIFACMYICATCMCLVPAEARRGCGIPGTVAKDVVSHQGMLGTEPGPL